MYQKCMFMISMLYVIQNKRKTKNINKVQCYKFTYIFVIIVVAWTGLDKNC